MKPRSALPVLLCSLWLACGPQSEDALASGSHALTALEEVSTFGSNPGNLRMLRHVPVGMPANAALLVALHGCTQTAADFEAAGFSVLADDRKYYVLYPEQRTANNPTRCFNWAGENGDTANLKRGEGENLSIQQMVKKMQTDFSIDPARIVVTGVSAGGAQTALMLATWPDVFTGGAVIAGIPYDCARGLLDASACSGGTKDLAPAEWAKRVKDAYPSFTGRYPRVALFQGTNDLVVRPANARELLEQWTAVHGIDATADETQQLGAHTRRAFKDGTGATLVETYELANMGHGVPVDLSAGCGVAGAFALDVKLCAASRIADFFQLGGAAFVPDAGLPPDGGARPDAGVDPIPDAGASRDAGSTPTPGPGAGCHCQGGVGGGGLAALLAVLAAVRAAARRR